MLSISVPSKLALSLHSVPPFVLETFLALVLVLLLAIPVFARVQMLLEAPVHYFILVSRKLPATEQPPALPPMTPLTPVISVNLQVNALRPSSLSPMTEEASYDEQLIHSKHLAPYVVKSSHLQEALHNAPRTLDYESYRHNFIGVNLKKLFGDRIPSNVILNAYHLSTIDSKVLLKLDRKIPEDLFSFLDYSTIANTSPRPLKQSFNPTDHFHLKKESETFSNMDKATDTRNHRGEIDQVPELIDFRDRAPTPTTPRSPRKRRHFVEGLDSLPPILNSKSAKKPADTSTLSPNTVGPEKQAAHAPKPARPELQRPEAPKTPISMKRPRKKSVKTEDNPNVKIRKERGIDGSSTKCPSVASSEAFSVISSSSKQPESVISRPTSSCGSSRGFRSYRSRVNSRPRSSGYFGWDIPDSPDTSYTNDPLAASGGPKLHDVGSHQDKDPKAIPASQKPTEAKPDSLKNKHDMSEGPPVCQPPQNPGNNITTDENPSSLIVNTPIANSMSRKSKLPVRRSEGNQRDNKAGDVDNTERTIRKKEDVALQVSRTVVSSGLDDIEKFVGEKVEGRRCNQDLTAKPVSSKERALRAGVSKERLQEGRWREEQSIVTNDVNASHQE